MRRNDGLGGNQREGFGNEIRELRNCGEWGHRGAQSLAVKVLWGGYTPRSQPGSQVLVQSFEGPRCPTSHRVGVLGNLTYICWSVSGVRRGLSEMELKAFFKDSPNIGGDHRNPFYKNGGTHTDTEYECRKYPNPGSGDQVYRPSHVTGLSGLPQKPSPAASCNYVSF